MRLRIIISMRGPDVMRHQGCHPVDRLQLEGIWRETFASTAISYAIDFAGLNISTHPRSKPLLFCCPCSVERTERHKKETYALTKPSTARLANARTTIKRSNIM